jgi:hypothetical protein
MDTKTNLHPNLLSINTDAGDCASIDVRYVAAIIENRRSLDMARAAGLKPFGLMLHLYYPTTPKCKNEGLVLLALNFNTEAKMQEIHQNILDQQKKFREAILHNS